MHSIDPVFYICGEGPHSLLQVIGLDKRQRESRYGGWGTEPEELALEAKIIPGEAVGSGRGSYVPAFAKMLLAPG